MKLAASMIGTVAICAFALIRYTDDHPGQASETPVARTIAVTKVTRENLAREINLTAELKPFQDINVHAKVSGFVKDINVDIGDQVKTGQVLASLDVAEQEADLAKAEASYKEAKLDYERIQGIIKKKPGLLAQDEVDKARSAYEVAKANREHAQAFTDYSVITAPFSGIITKRYADKGQLIQAGTSGGSQPVVHLSDNTRLRLVFPIPESIVPQIKVGTPVEVNIQATRDTLKSNIVRASGMIDNATRTMEVEVDIENPDLHLTPGMYASVKIDLNKQVGVLAVPVQAIAGKEKPNVWVVNAQNQIEEHSVKLGIQTPEKVEVLSGLSEGDNVVFGNRNASPGSKVTPVLVESGMASGEGAKL